MKQNRQEIQHIVSGILRNRINMSALAVVATLAVGAAAAAQHAGHGSQATTDRPPAPITMDELHRAGGVPRGWTFTLPAGDPKTGRELFAKLECNKCHEVAADFPRGQRAAGDVGPALTGMGGHHPAEYLAQSIIDPNAVIVAGPGFVGPDGRSVMPDYRDSVTFADVVHLVAYLKSLDAGGHAHQSAPPPRERTAGPYRVRLEYHGPAASHEHGGHGAGGHAHGAPAARPAGHLMVFVADATTAERIPYLPVTAVITAGKDAGRTLRLAPMLGDDGFHYGADVALPPGTSKITVTLGVPTLKTMGGVAGRFGKPVTLGFDWSD
jgi:hypothetical protein